MWPVRNAGGGIGGPGSFSSNTRTITTSGNVLTSDGVVRGDTSAASVTALLPPAASAYDAAKKQGSIFTFKKVDAANTFTIQAQPGEMIDEFNTADMVSLNETLSMQSNGVSYDVLFRSQ